MDNGKLTIKGEIVAGRRGKKGYWILDAGFWCLGFRIDAGFWYLVFGI
jgi:hypothetical protein